MLATGGSTCTAKTGLIPFSLLDGTHQFGLCCPAHLQIVLFGYLSYFIQFHACSPLNGNLITLRSHSLSTPPKADHINRIQNQGYLTVAKDGGTCGAVHFAVIGFKTLDHHLMLSQ